MGMKHGLNSLKLYLLIFFCVLLALSLVRDITKINEVKKRVERAEEKVEKLKTGNKILEEELKKIQQSEYLEKQLRDKLGLAKEGETVVILPDPETLKKLVPEIPDEKDYLPDPPYVKWLKLFDVKI